MDDLEGANINVEKLVNRLKIRFPEYNFDQTPQHDRRCKKSENGVCTIQKHLTYSTDMEGNDFCIKRIKLRDDNNPYLHKEITCNAVIRTAKEKELTMKGGF